MNRRGTRPRGGRRSSVLWAVGAVVFLLFLAFAASVGAVRELGTVVWASVAPACPEGKPAAYCRTVVTGTVASARQQRSTVQGQPGSDPVDHWVYWVRVDPAMVPATTDLFLNRILIVTPRSTTKLMSEGEKATLELLHDDIVQVTNASGRTFHGGAAKEPRAGWVTIPLAVGPLMLIYGFAIHRLVQSRRPASMAPRGPTDVADAVPTDRWWPLTGVAFVAAPIVFAGSVVTAVVAIVATYLPFVAPRWLAPIALTAFVLTIVVGAVVMRLASRRGAPSRRGATRT